MEKSIKTILKQAGFRATPIRLKVFEILLKSTKPLTILGIKNALIEEEMHADKATLYRIIEAYTQKRLVTRFEFQEGKFRYELTRGEHHHLICNSCGVIRDLNDCPVTAYSDQVTQKEQFQITRHTLDFYGVCRDCQSV